MTGRAAQGVRLMRTEPGERIVSIARVLEQEDGEEIVAPLADEGGAEDAEAVEGGEE